MRSKDAQDYSNSKIKQGKKQQTEINIHGYLVLFAHYDDVDVDDDDDEICIRNVLYETTFQSNCVSCCGCSVVFHEITLNQQHFDAQTYK